MENSYGPRARATPSDPNHKEPVPDPVLNGLIYLAYHQNINLKDFGTRILQARGSAWHRYGQPLPANSRR